MSYFKRVVIEDTAGNPVEIETVDGNKYLGVSSLQDVHVSDGNGSTSNLTSGATFTGTAQDTLGFAAAQINLKTDQNCTVYVDQSMDGTNWDITDTYIYYYSFGGQSWTVQMTASWVRVRVTNNGASTTTYLRLQMAMCPVVESMPRSLTQSGNLKTSIEEMLGTFSRDVWSTPMGELMTAERTRLVGTAFRGTTFDTNFWTKTTQTGNANATLAGGQLTLTTGTPTANGSIIVNSVRIARYAGGTGNYYRAIVRAPAVTGTNIRRWGVFDANSGFFFEHNGTTLSLVCRKTGSDANVISSGSFNGTLGSVYTLNTNVNTFEIHWTNSSTYFLIGGEILHKFTGSTEPLSDTTNFQIGMQCTNSGGNTAANTLEIRVASILRLGQLLTQSTYKNITTATTTVCKYGAGVLHKIILNRIGDGGATIVIYDNTTATGTTIGTITMDRVTGASEVPVMTDYTIPFSTGLTILTTGTTGDYTITYE